jgi:hypothetical protein
MYRRKIKPSRCVDFVYSTESMCDISEMPTIVHFKIPTDDVERSRKFYSDLFGWKIEK